MMDAIIYGGGTFFISILTMTLGYIIGRIQGLLAMDKFERQMVEAEKQGIYYQCLKSRGKL